MLRSIRRALKFDDTQETADAKFIGLRYLDSGTPFSEPDLDLDLPDEPAPDRFKRSIDLIQSCLHALKGPACAAGRTAVIVLLTLAIREAVTYCVTQALNSNDVSEANRAWATAGVMLASACMNMLGALREECMGCANTRSRLGRAAMLGLCAAAGLALALYGDVPGMLPSATGTLVYSMVRDVTNAFFPINTNVQDYSVLPTAAAAGLYGAMGVLFDTLAAQVPPIQSDLGYGLFNHWRDALPGMVAIMSYSVLDDLILPLLNHGPWQATERPPLEIDVSRRWASVSDMARAVTTNAALRASAINVINALYGVTLAQLTTQADENAEVSIYQQVIGGTVLAASFAMIYLPFVFGTLASPRAAASVPDVESKGPEITHL
jgi:hypothetical protein